MWIGLRESVAKTISATIRGRVQGVGYRDWVERQAIGIGLRGYVRNRRDGSVELVLSGSDQQVESMLALCKQGPRLAAVSDIEVASDDWAGEGFQVLPTF
jgi:acylphosphatase